MKDPQIKIKLLGPFDRFNYGDLIFPRMVEYAFETISPRTFQFECFSLVAADLRKAGGYRTRSYRDFVHSIRTDDENFIVVAGGQVLDAKWDLLYYYVNPNFVRLNRISKGVLRRLLSPQTLLGGVSEFPFCVDTAKFLSKPKVFYNSVGCGGPDPALASRLESSEYLAVREPESKEILRSIGISNVEVVPDSAVILSDVCEETAFLNGGVRTEIAGIREDSYIFFQIGEELAPSDLSPVADQLRELARHSKKLIVLCPIGTASGHRDDVPLKRLQEMLLDESRYVHKPTVPEIAFLLSRSSVYIGTSLHGAITSISFGRPYVGLTEVVPKLNAYLSFWGHPELQTGASITNFSEAAKRALEVPASELKDHADEQKKLYYSSAERMVKLILEAKE